MGQPEHDLLTRARGVDADALAQLLKAHTPAIRRALEANFPQRFRAQLDVDDLLSITYTDVCRDIARCPCRDEASFAAWLKQAALRDLRDAVRHLEAGKRPDPARRVTPSAPADATQSFLIELLGADSVTPSRGAMRSEAAELLCTSLERLPDDYRRAIQLYDIEGRTIDEVAKALGRSAGAVHLLRDRAKSRLREVLGPHQSFFRNLA